MSACPVYRDEQVDAGPRCCDLSCRLPTFGPDDPPEPGMVWMPAHHLVGADLSYTCTSCGGHTAVAAPCIPGRWYHWLQPDVPLAEQELDSRGAD